MAYRTIHENRLARFMRRIEIDPETGCWNWTGHLNAGGYGYSKYKGKSSLAHVAVYRCLRGEYGDGLDLDHLCRNRRCVNPDHCEPVTRRENLHRGFEARGCKNGHAFNTTDFSVLNRSNGIVERRCKICHRERNKRAKQNALRRMCVEIGRGV